MAETITGKQNRVWAASCGGRRGRGRGETEQRAHREGVGAPGAAGGEVEVLEFDGDGGGRRGGSQPCCRRSEVRGGIGVADRLIGTQRFFQELHHF
jgi:hypothetical protein